MHDRQSVPWPAATPGLVVLPSGRRVVGCAGRTLPELDSELVVALDRGRIPSGAEVLRVAWPDFRAPRDPIAAVATLRLAYAAAATQRVAVCCRGGRGRTGTALAVLAVIDGVAADEAVSWVRSAYDQRAVETVSQERWVRAVPALLR